jgi:DNA-binding response OmpR family regulator
MSHAPQILVIDDDPAVRRLCEKVLSQDGYYVACAASGRQALVLTRNTVFDIVVLDLSLCDMDGFRLLEEIRSESPLVRVLAVSGFMKSFLHDIVTDAGAHAALAKPISPRTLQEAVYRLIDPTCSWQGERPDA